MDIEKNILNIQKMKCLLNFERNIIGVKFLFTKEEYDACESIAIKKPMSYCVLVKSAMAGNNLKMAVETSGCFGASAVLGIAPVADYEDDGRLFHAFGLYDNLGIARKSYENVVKCGHKIYGLTAMPLENFKTEPDVVLMVGESYDMMRIIQGYSYKFGIKGNYRLGGNQAFCSECTAYPFKENTLNISLLCSGTRFKSGWGNSEVLAGIPFNQFDKLVEGIESSMERTDSDEKKELIEKKLKEANIYDITVTYGSSYYHLKIRDEVGKKVTKWREA